jgi:hypothetical protein
MQPRYRARRRPDVSTPVVLLPVTGYDAIYALEKARRLGKSVAILSYRRPIAELQLAPELLTIRFRQETYTTLDQAEQKIDLLSSEGWDVVVGSFGRARGRRLERPAAAVAGNRAMRRQSLAGGQAAWHQPVDAVAPPANAISAEKSKPAEQIM